MDKKILICGSRTLSEEQKQVVLRTLEDMQKEDQYFTNASIYQGGAKGVDFIAKEFATKFNIPHIIIRPVNENIKTHYLYRNVELITLTDEVLAFWDSQSSGTKFVIDYAKARNKKVTIFNLAHSHT